MCYPDSVSVGGQSVVQANKIAENEYSEKTSPILKKQNSTSSISTASTSDSVSSSESSSVCQEVNYPLIPVHVDAWIYLGLHFFTCYKLSILKHMLVYTLICLYFNPFANFFVGLKLLLRQVPWRRFRSKDGKTVLPLRFHLVGAGNLLWGLCVKLPFECTLWYLDDFLFPRYRDTDVSAPVLLLGQPRSGTTKFQDVLAEDPETFCSLTLFEMRCPYLTIQYTMDFFAWLDKTRFFNGRLYRFACWAGLMNALPPNEKMDAMRRLRYDLPDEDDIMFLFHMICHLTLAGMWPDAELTKLLYNVDELPTDIRQKYIRFHETAVKKVMYRRGNGRKYLAKWVACWNGFLDDAQTVYPNAKYVMIVRDRTQQAPSWMKLQSLMAQSMSGHDVMKNFPEVRQQILDINIEWYHRQIKFCKETSRDNLHIVRFTDFVADIPHEINNVYNFLGQEIVDGSPYHQCLQRHYQNQKAHKQTRVSSDEQYLSKEEIMRTFPDLLKEIKFSNDVDHGKTQ